MQSVSFASNGNITGKTGLGSYSYTSSHPHAVTGVENTDGLAGTVPQYIQYNGLNKVSGIFNNCEPDSLLDFNMAEDNRIGEEEGRLPIRVTRSYVLYGPDEQRWLMTIHTFFANQSKHVKYIYANDYEKRINGQDSIQYYYIGEGLVYVKRPNYLPFLYYACTDNLGSYRKLVNAMGMTPFKASYDAWGNQTVSQESFYFRRGYTGHEMLPEYGLINMNGRLYDPQLGRFLSPDNYVQMPDFSQSFNRYSYCINNPLKYTDPDGEIFGFVGGFIRGLIKAVFHHHKWYTPFTDAWKGLKNDAKITWGLFQGKFGQVISRFTWELPQSILGYTYSLVRNGVEDIDYINYFDGATFLVKNTHKTNNGVTIGSFININTKDERPIDDNGNFAPYKYPLFMHEYGHYIQSQKSGLAYLFYYATPSIWSVIKSSFKDEDSKYINTSAHKRHWMERSASRYAKKYFKKYGVDWDSDIYKIQNKPITYETIYPTYK